MCEVLFRHLICNFDVSVVTVFDNLTLNLLILLYSKSYVKCCIVSLSAVYLGKYLMNSVGVYSLIYTQVFIHMDRILYLMLDCLPVFQFITVR